MVLVSDKNRFAEVASLILLSGKEDISSETITLKMVLIMVTS
jgi:hypothetical protein